MVDNVSVEQFALINGIADGEVDSLIAIPVRFQKVGQSKGDHDQQDTEQAKVFLNLLPNIQKGRLHADIMNEKG